MNKSKIFFALVSLMGPLTATPVTALQIPTSLVTEQSVREMIKKIETGVQTLNQVPAIKTEAEKLLEDVKQASLLGSSTNAPGTNYVMRNQSFIKAYTDLEQKFKAPKETDAQVQTIIAAVSAQISGAQNPLVKALGSLLTPLKTKFEAFKAPITETSAIITQIKDALEKLNPHKKGFKPEKHPNGLIIDEHKNGLIIPDDHHVKPEDTAPPSPDANVDKTIVEQINAIYTTLKPVLSTPLVSKTFPEVKEANLEDFVKAYNAQADHITQTLGILDGQVKSLLTSTETKAVVHAWVKAAAKKLYDTAVNLRADLVSLEKVKAPFASKATFSTIPDVSKIGSLLKFTKGDLGEEEESADIGQALAELGLPVGKDVKNYIKNITPAEIQALVAKVQSPVTELSKNKTLLNEFNQIAENKEKLTAFSEKYKNAIPSYTILSNAYTPLTNLLKSVKKSKKTDVKAEASNLEKAVSGIKALPAYNIFLSTTKKVKGKPVVIDSKYAALVKKLNQ